MHRKQFLRQAVITLPAAMLAPELLFSAGNKTTANPAASSHDLVIINGTDAKAGLIAACKNAVTTPAEQVSGISFTGGQWHIELAKGKTYVTPKLVINGTGCEMTGTNAIHITGLARQEKICFGQRRNLEAAKQQQKEQTPQVWMHSHEKMDAQAFEAFVRKGRPVLLYVS